ncbi:L,D-transpeptidase [Paenarthrobacter sp. DKR-5]|uniref:L,D-transpeptidase n=1 Tax=Paenarthrobacter sp. DKR-5 TaxID=2835535 RepID=UPI001BDC9659|nr:Ig-like domain-containing protein [Paenarthrobacter sp. DKR-5]MBT1002427.1 L,D-transpeptidase [Paenarthrobacter sp. DKR-5]
MAEKTTRTRWKIGALVAAGALVLAGGIGVATAPSWARSPIGSEASAPARAVPGFAAPVVKPVQIGATPVDGAQHVNPALPVEAKAAGGKITNVSLVADDGTEVQGTTSADGSTWTAKGPLAFNATYTWNFTAVDGAGRETKKTETFQTVPTLYEADAAIYPQDGQQVGVAQPIEINFSEPVTNKAAVEKAIKITTTSHQAGAFHWYSDKKVRYRAKDFWAAHSTITVAMNLFGVDFGGGQIGNFNKTISIPIGDKKVAIADATAMKMTVSINDKPAGSWPVTMGDKRFPSARGYLVLMGHQRKAHFVAATIGLKPGDPANYGELDVNYATRLTWSGEFIHQATDTALPYLGVINLSHGCIGMSAQGAGWVFNHMGVGDVVKVVNTKGDYADHTDGFGDWNIPWAQYAKR